MHVVCHDLKPLACNVATQMKSYAISWLASVAIVTGAFVSVNLVFDEFVDGSKNHKKVKKFVPTI